MFVASNDNLIEAPVVAASAVARQSQRLVARVEGRVSRRWVFWLAAAATFVSFFVFTEPAPCDYLLFLAIAVSLVTADLGSFGLRGSRRPAVLLLAAWASATVLSILNSLEISRAISFSAISLYLMLTWAVLSDVLDRFGPRAASGLFNADCAGAILAAVVGCLEVAGVVPSITWHGERAAAFFKDPNLFGSFMVPPSLYALARACQTGRRRLLWLLSLLLLFMGTVISFSRGAWINYAAAVVLFLWLSRSTLRTALSYVAIAAVFAVAASWMLCQASESFRSSVGDRTQVLHPYDDDRFRTQRRALDVGIDSVIGIGPGQSEAVFEYATHSLYLRILAENGIVGLVTFGLFLTISIARCIRLAGKSSEDLRTYYAVAAASLVGLVLNSFVIDTLHWRHFWLLLAYAWCSPWGTNREAEE